MKRLTATLREQQAETVRLDGAITATMFKMVPDGERSPGKPAKPSATSSV